MTHRGWHRAVEAWVDGELGDVRAGLVRDHLGQCAGCSSHAALLRSVKESLRRRSVPPPLGAVRRRRFAGWLTDPGSMSRPLTDPGSS